MRQTLALEMAADYAEELKGSDTPDNSFILPIDDNDEGPEDQPTTIIRVLLLGDANVGKYQFFESLQEFAQDNEVSQSRGWTSVPIRSGHSLSFNHIEGLEEDPLLRKWKYKNVNIFLVFFSLANLESLTSAAYKWGPEVQNVIEHLGKNGVRVQWGLIGLLSDRSQPSLIPSHLIDSLKAMLSPDFYFEMSKSFTVGAVSDLILLLEGNIFNDYVFTKEDDNTSESSHSSEESSLIPKQAQNDDDDDRSICPFLGLDDEELLSEFSLSDSNPPLTTDGIFNAVNIVVRRPREVELKNKIEVFRRSVKSPPPAETTLAKEDYNYLLEQIQGILLTDAENIPPNYRDNRTSRFFISSSCGGHSEQSLWYKRHILPQVIPETPSWNVSLWNKKKFKEFINEDVSHNDRNELLEKLKEGFQHLTAANHCHSPSIPSKYLGPFENTLLECIRLLSTDSNLSIIKISDFYLLCQYNLIKCLEYLIYRYPKGFGYLMMSYSRRNYRNPHPLNCIDNEFFILKVMKIYHPKLYSAHRDRNGYNFLHYFGDKNFRNALNLYFQYDISNPLDPFLHKDDGSSPIAVAAQSGNECIAIDMFEHLNKHFESSPVFLSYFQLSEFKSKSLLGICTQQKQHILLSKIIDSFIKRGLQKDLMDLLAKQLPSDGDLTLMQCINSEKIMMKLIEPYLKDNPRHIILKCKKENHLGHAMAQRNYFNVLQTIHEFCSKRSLNDLFFFEFMFAPNKYGDDCLKLAAWKGSNEFLVSALSMCRGLEQTYLSLLLHAENKNQENLLELLLFQQGSLLVPRQIIMLMEKEFHDSNRVSILSCYKEHISPSEGLVSLIEDTTKLLPLSTPKKAVYILKQSTFFILSISLYFLDVALDISLAVKYNNITDVNCYQDFYSFNETTVESNYDRTQRYIGALCYSSRFYFTLTFILSPWLFYTFEFLNETFINDRPMYFVHVPYKNIIISSFRSMLKSSKQLQAKIEQLEDTRLKWEKATYYRNAGNNLLFILAFTFEFIFTIVFWPVLSMVKTFRADIMYNIEHGQKKIDARQHKVSATKVSSRARLIEALLESSFQPILQLYLVLPILMHNITSNKSRQLTQDLILEVIQFGSAISSIAAISWAITSYQADSKGGAMDITVNFLGRAILLLSNLFTITGRLLLFVVFAYGFGAGRLIGLIVFILLHVLITTFLIHIWRNPEIKIKSKISYFINCIFNGFGNCYLHMWISLPQKKLKTPKSHVSSFQRQMVFEALFFVELCSMSTFTSFMLDPRVAQALHLEYLILFIFKFYFIGLGLRVIYYEFLHLWSGLISFPREIKRFFRKIFKEKSD